MSSLKYSWASLVWKAALSDFARYLWEKLAICGSSPERKTCSAAKLRADMDSEC